MTATPISGIPEACKCSRHDLTEAGREATRSTAGFGMTPGPRCTTPTVATPQAVRDFWRRVDL